MNKGLILDTDILIDAGRGKSDAIELLHSLVAGNNVCLSAVTEMEMIVGCRNKNELREIDHFLEQFAIIPINPEISISSIKLLKTYRLSHGLLIADSLIAATALHTKRTLVSGNAKHFSMIKDLHLRTRT
jgi:predicted nucleic acid-binding protein